MSYIRVDSRIYCLGTPMVATQNLAYEDKAMKLQLRLAQLEKNEACQEKFLTFVKTMWPDFIAGRHHRIIADKLERVASGELKRSEERRVGKEGRSRWAAYRERKRERKR